MILFLILLTPSEGFQPSAFPTTNTHIELCSDCLQFDSLYNSIPCDHGYCLSCASAWQHRERCVICRKEISLFLHKLYRPNEELDMPPAIRPGHALDKDARFNRENDLTLDKLRGQRWGAPGGKACFIENYDCHID